MEENPDKIDEYLDTFVDIQVNILSKKSSMLPKLRSKMSEKVDKTDLDATTRYELQARISGMKKHNKLCHGDFCPANIIITDDGEKFIVDWAHATQGNASADAARTYLTFKLKGQDEIAEKYLNLFSLKTDIAKQLVQRWMPIVAASQSVKHKPEERDFLLSWVDVAEYE
jgi:thiamine kinase-like enzyme